MASEIKISNIKANDGTGALTIANSNGNITNAGTFTSTGAITASGGIANAGTIGAGTLGSSVVFPAGHIIQSVYNPTITNTTTDTKTTDTAIADVINQITITSGNGVAIYCSAWCITNPAGNSYGSVAIKEGTVASPSTELFRCHYGSGSNVNSYAQESFWAYDSTPASTTPSYCISINKGSGSTASVYVYSFVAEYFRIHLFEVQQ